MSAFSSVDLFYELDRARRTSRETSYGSQWRQPGDDRTYQLAWIEKTGELVLVRADEDPGGPRRISVATHETGIRALIRQSELSVFVVATIHGRGQVDELLDGWAEQCGNPDSLDWLITRIVTAGVR